MLKHTFLLVFSMAVGWVCSDQKPITVTDNATAMKTAAMADSSLINTAHLEHLYEEITVDGDTLGTIWIYAEAPDYRLITDDDEGFTCIDDVARALVFYCKQQRVEPQAEYLDKIKKLSAFILHLQNENGYFNNFIFPETYKINTTHRTSVAEPNWWSWRALWALSEVNLLNENSLTDLQQRNQSAIERLMENLQNWCPNPDATMEVEGIILPKCVENIGSDQPAVMLLGLANLYQKQPTAEVENLMTKVGQQILKFQKGNADEYPYHAFLSWQNYWHAYGNSQAYALLVAGRLLKSQKFINAGLNEVRYFYPYIIKENFFADFQLKKTEAGFANMEVKKFAQIAYGMRPMIYATLEAYQQTNDAQFLQTAESLTQWFFGNNPVNQQMYDPATGRTFDGIISATEYNKNSGAESTIEGLLSIQAVEAVVNVKPQNSK